MDEAKIPSVEESQGLLINSTNNSEREIIAERKSSFKLVIGFILALLIVLNGISQSEYAQFMYGDLNFKSYYFLSWFTYIWLSFSFPFYLLCNYPSKQLSIYFSNDKTLHFLSWKEYFESVKKQLRSNPNFGMKRYLFSAFIVTLLNFFSTYTWYISLDKIPVSINQTLYNSIVVFVFILSVIFLKEKLRLIKILALAFVIAGVVLVGQSSHSEGQTFSEKDKVEGYILVLVGAFLWACYEVVYKKLFGDINSVGVMLVQTYIGLFTLLFLWIFIPILMALGVEPSFSFTPEVVSFLFGNVLFAVSYFIFFAFAIAVTNPIYISLTSMLGIPLSGLADYILHKDSFSQMTIIGMVLVLFGVMLINIEKYVARKFLSKSNTFFNSCSNIL